MITTQHLKLSHTRHNRRDEIYILETRAAVTTRRQNCFRNRCCHSIYFFSFLAGVKGEGWFLLLFFTCFITNYLLISPLANNESFFFYSNHYTAFAIITATHEPSYNVSDTAAQSVYQLTRSHDGRQRHLPRLSTHSTVMNATCNETRLLATITTYYHT